jgi:hypothetical protein
MAKTKMESRLWFAAEKGILLFDVLFLRGRDMLRVHRNGFTIPSRDHGL